MSRLFPKTEKGEKNWVNKYRNMSILIPIARSTFLRDALSRSLSSSRILTKVRVLGTKIQDTCCFTSFTKKEKEKKSVLNFGHKFKELGGTKVVIAYFGL